MTAIRRAARQALNAASVVREPLFSPPGNFCSPVAGGSDTDRARNQLPAMAYFGGLDLRAAAQLELAAELGPRWSEFARSWRRYHPDNRMYGPSDGAVYYSILRTVQPRRVIEVGSGFSSAAALDLRDELELDLDLTFVEPYPERLLGLLEEADRTNTTLYRSAVQDVPLAIYDELEAGDILFIDSTHVSKAGSDVNWLFFHVLPRLRPGVVVHLHDIFYPFEYPDAWLSERRSWDESYLLRAFLSFNTSFEITFFSSWIWQEHPEIVERYLPDAVGDRPGSIWLRRTGPVG